MCLAAAAGTGAPGSWPGKPRGRDHKPTLPQFVGDAELSECRLLDQAAKYRQLAETAEDLRIKQELLDLAGICEEVANNIEDRLPGG
jgi:hypothetical protein